MRRTALISLTAFTTVFLLSSCKGYKARYSESYIKVETTPCFGSCPVYELTINGNGVAEYEKKQFFEDPGTYRLKLEPGLVNDLFRQFSSQSWDTLANEYPTPYSDLPSTILTFSHKRIEKQIVITGNHPPVLDSLIRGTNQVRNLQGWVNVQEM